MRWSPDRLWLMAMFGLVVVVAAGLCRVCRSAWNVRPIAVGMLAASLRTYSWF